MRGSKANVLMFGCCRRGGTSSSSASKTIWLLNLLALASLAMMAWRRCCCLAIPLERRMPAGNEVDEELAEDDRGMALRYLLEFGHLASPIPTPMEMRNALETFQDMVGLAKTGEMDAPTLDAMRMPRCGNGDVGRTRQRRRRFVYISRWEDKVKDGELRLKWFIHNYTPDISREQIRNTVNQAFGLWSAQVKIQAMESISLHFEEATSEGEADITILWAEGDHGDAHKFDGPGEDGSNILAHTFYPNYQFKGTLNGDIHLDDFEQWRVDNGRDGGASFPHVLVHEIGHTLGLGHSKKQQAIMFPIYRKEQLDQMQLDIDDKCAINWSYVGATDLCLYIWLLAEVLPKKVAMEEGGMPTAASNNGEGGNKPMSSSNMLQNDDEPKWEPSANALVRAQLAGKAMPECAVGEAGDRMRHQLAEMLRRRLGFPKEMAQPYANILCRFFDGFRREFGLPGTGHLHQVIRPIGAHAYLQPNSDNFAALERALNREGQRQFDAAFFAKLMAKFVGNHDEQMERRRRRK